MTKIRVFSGGKFVFTLILSQFCRKINDMKRAYYENLLGCLEVCQPALGAELEFSLLCMCSGLRRTAIENRIYHDFGMSGEEIVECLSDMM